MIIENPAALQFILNEQIYLNKSDMGNLAEPLPVVAVADEPDAVEASVVSPEPVIAEKPAPVAAEPEPVVTIADEPVMVETSVVTQEPVISETPAPVVAEPEPVIQTPVLSFNYSGKNAKGFLIVCHYPGLDSMDEKHLAALVNTLQRKELSLDDVAIINLAQHAGATAKQLHAFFKPSRLLILGSQGILPGWDTLVFNQLLEKNGFKALYTDSFTDMMTDREKAKAFWEQMKQL